MKNYKSALLTALAFVLLIGMSSCNKEGGPAEGEWGEMFNGPEWLVQEPDISPVEVMNGTLDRPFEMVHPDYDVRFLNGNGNDGKKGMGKRRFMPLGRILRSLELTEEQIELVKGYMFDYRLCIKDIMMNLRETERELLAPFHEQRKIIFEAYKNGELTREEAKAQLQELAQQVRETMQNNPLRVQACEAMKECMKLMQANVGSVLTPEQLVKWEEWIANLPDKPCEREG
ncbi:Spy/CpxP family protein refolding chaperone [Bacteroidota bacterium]